MQQNYDCAFKQAIHYFQHPDNDLPLQFLEQCRLAIEKPERQRNSSEQTLVEFWNMRHQSW